MSEGKVKKIFKNLEEQLDAIVVKNSSESLIYSNFFYATGLTQGLFEGCAVVLFPDGKTDLIVNKLESELAYQSDSDVKIFQKDEEFKSLLKNSLKNTSKIGLNFSNISYKEFITLRDIFSKKSFIDVSNAFLKARAVKDADELELITEAVYIADSVMEKIPEILKENMKEFELSAEINYLIQKYGADKPAFDTISSFGKNSSKPHYSHGDKKISPGDFVLCDFGACYKKYNSDITRTFTFKETRDKQKKMFETVLNAQKKAFDMIKPGVKAKEIHIAVQNYIDKTEFSDCFIHGTGHSLGLDIHDGYVGFTPNSDVTLVENMVLTVEPGVYIPDFGGVRIEDDILVTSDGCKILSKSNRDLIQIC